MFLDKRNARQGHRTFIGCVLAAHCQARWQQDNTSVAPVRRAARVDGNAQNGEIFSVDLFLQPRAFTLQLEHQSPGFDQAFATVLAYERCFTGRAPESFDDPSFVGIGQVQLGDDFAQVSGRQAVEQAHALLVIVGGDLPVHQHHAL
ncbi:hypothetical protein D3C73_854240 [compost metagenome]